MANPPPTHTKKCKRSQEDGTPPSLRHLATPARLLVRAGPSSGFTAVSSACSGIA